MKLHKVLKQFLIFIVKNGNKRQIIVGGHTLIESTITNPISPTENRALFAIGEFCYLLRAGLTTNVYQLPSSNEWKNMYYSERKLRTYFHSVN